MSCVSELFAEGTVVLFRRMTNLYCRALTMRAERLREGVLAFSFVRICAIKLKLVPLISQFHSGKYQVLLIH